MRISDWSSDVCSSDLQLIVGPTGAGKSVLLALLALQFRRYQGAQVYIFDKGLSARAAVLAMGGEHHALGETDTLAFQPLRDIHDATERTKSDERCVGKECVRTGRSRWSTYS